MHMAGVFALTGRLQVFQHAFQVQGAHFVLVLYICALSSSSHLAALITLRKYFRRYRLIAKIRLTLVIVFACFLLASMIAAIGMPELVRRTPHGTPEKQPRAQRLSFLVPMVFIAVGFSTALVCMPQRKSASPRGTSIWNHDGRGAHPRLGARSRSVAVPANFGIGLFYIVFVNPLVAFIIQLLLALLSTVLVLSQKFSVPEEPGKWCGLQDEGENQWGFGQTLSVVMLLLPAMSAAQAYLEGRQHIQKGGNLEGLIQMDDCRLYNFPVARDQCRSCPFSVGLRW
jgi:hypothetical protein